MTYAQGFRNFGNGINIGLRIISHTLLMLDPHKTPVHPQSGSMVPVLRWIGRVLAALLLIGGGAPVAAQTVSFPNTTVGTINGSTSCSSPLIRNFVVGSSFTISDVDLGVLVTHSWRGDLQITLQSPAGTRVQLVNGDINSTNGDNFNVMLNDAGTQTVNTDSVTAAHSAIAPPYANNFSPNNPLSAFNGQNSAGTWRLEICDLFPTADDGVFQRADLMLTQTPTNWADLSLAKTVSNTAPAVGTTISYTLTVSNAAGSTDDATGVTVLDQLPAGFMFLSASGVGSYNSATGVWSVGTVVKGGSAAITITGTVTATSGASVVNNAEITDSLLPDLDSTPNNASTTEDDDAAIAFTVSGARVAGTPPILACPATTVFDWDAITWAAGSTTNSYAVSEIGSVGWSISNQGSWLNSATYGGQSPAEQTAVTGGLAAAGQSLFLLTDMADRAQSANVVITLPTAVPGAQFRIFDVDAASGQFADRITVSGSFNGASVTPVLTNGVTNYVIGASAYGDATSADTSGNGNVWVTFTGPVDTIAINYGNHAAAPTNPGQQAIALHDISFCRPQANVTVTKTSTVIEDPVNGTTDPKMIPGATVRYCILASNAGSATMTNVVATDALPSNVAYVPGSMSSAGDCSAAGTAEDDDAVGADESDPIGMQIAGTTITGTAATLGPAQSMALRFRVIVN